MARRQKNDNDLLMEDELTAAFLDDATPMGVADEPATTIQSAPANDEDWDDEQMQDMPGMLAVDVYETKEKLYVKARTAGVNRDDLDVSIADNTLTIKGTLSSGDDVETEDYHIQECYWGEFSRTLALPVPVKEDEVEAVLKDGVLTIGFTKLKQEVVKKITIS
ncbi:Hsp20/alpha crystallin family protein [Candidatus Saccharibacteria bacterium]|nr:Hsp20/alpha crystallin family protein [Candidatus Saccharibacteria bacterium]